QPATLTAVVAPTPVAPPDPVAIVARLRALRANAGVSSARMGRQIIYALEELIAIGPSALPAIREFLSRNEDVDYDLALAAQGKSQRGTVPNDFVLPPSLRFGLLDATRQIGGAEAEAILADILASTGRGVELAWLARVLQELVPNKYRDVALTAARELLSRPLASAGSPLDRNDREHLFNVLSMYGDKSYVTTAQSQLVQADGVLDRNALRYLQQTLGSQAVP